MKEICNYKEIPLENEDFQNLKFNNQNFNFEQVIQRDMDNIIKNAKEYKKDFENMYNTDSLRPYFARVFYHNNIPIYAMVIYSIKYKESIKFKESFSVERTACGNYYPFVLEDNIYKLIYHHYQESICW